MLLGGISGATGAVMSEVLVEALDDLISVYETSYEEGMSQQEYDNLVKAKLDSRNDIVKIVTTASSALMGLDPNISFYTANNALTHNFMSNISGISGALYSVIKNAEENGIDQKEALNSPQVKAVIKTSLQLQTVMAQLDKGDHDPSLKVKLFKLLNDLGGCLEKMPEAAAKALKVSSLMASTFARASFYVCAMGQGAVMGAGAGVLTGPLGVAGGGVVGGIAGLVGAYGAETAFDMGAEALLEVTLETASEIARETGENESRFVNNVSNALEFGGEVLSFFGAAGAGVGLKHVGRTVEGRFGSSSGGGNAHGGEAQHLFPSFVEQSSTAGSVESLAHSLTTQPKPGGVVRASSIPQGSKIQYIRPGVVVFDGVEFRAVRDLGHLTTEELQDMLRKGINPRDIDSNLLVGHHYNQQYHREPGAFMVEIPKDNHCISNSIQHPLGTSGGLSIEERADWNKLRKAFNKERAKTELEKRSQQDGQ